MYRSIKYRISDGAIISILHSTIPLLPQVTDSGTEGELLDVDESHAVFTAQDRWRVVDGMLALKPVVILTPDKVTFTADGVDGCVISHDHAAPLTIRVIPGSEHLLAVGESLTIKSQIGRRFTVSVTDSSLCADPITVEAI